MGRDGIADLHQGEWNPELLLFHSCQLLNGNFQHTFGIRFVQEYGHKNQRDMEEGEQSQYEDNNALQDSQRDLVLCFVPSERSRQ